MDVSIEVDVWYDKSKEKYEAQCKGSGGTATGPMACNAVVSALELQVPVFRPGNTVQIKVRETAPKE